MLLKRFVTRKNLWSALNKTNSMLVSKFNTTDAYPEKEAGLFIESTTGVCKVIIGMA